MIVDPELELSEAQCQNIERLLYKETECLNNDQLDDWLKLFAADCTYWVPLSSDQSDPLDHPSLFYEDRTLMEMRVLRLKHPQAHSLKYPLRTNRITGTLTLRRDKSSSDLAAQTRFHMDEYQNETMRVFSGVYRYRLRPLETGEFLIAEKRVDLINVDAAFKAIQGFI